MGNQGFGTPPDSDSRADDMHREHSPEEKTLRATAGFEPPAPCLILAAVFFLLSRSLILPD
jgi:hypothetical protein